MENETKTVYILSETIERKISIPMVYLDFQSAFSELLVHMAQAFGYGERFINAMLKDLEDGSIEDCCGLMYNEETGYVTAYGENANHDNIDWYICPVEIP